MGGRTICWLVGRVWREVGSSGGGEVPRMIRSPCRRVVLNVMC